MLVCLTKDGMVSVWSAGMYMAKDGMVTAWSTGTYDQRWLAVVLVCMTKDGMVSAWSAGMFDQTQKGHSLEC